MKEISPHIELKFYEVLNHKTGIQDFEKWLYEANDLEAELSEETYVDLISINYKSKFAYNDLEKVIGNFVNNGKFEIKRIKRVLESIINRGEKCAESIEMTYDLYCSGYKFLRRLGLRYGLLIACPPAGNYQRSWNEIGEKEQIELLDKLYPEIIEDAKNALCWIEYGKIIIKNTVNELGNYEYNDLRNQDEINQGEMEMIDLDREKEQEQADNNGSNTTGESQNENLNQKNNFWSKLKSWWS